MKKPIYFFISIILLNFFIVTPALSISGGFLKIFKIFKGGGDDVIKSTDDLLRGTKNQGENITKSTDELLKDLNNKSVSQQVGPSQESLIVEKIGINEHSSELSALKELPRKSYLKRLNSKRAKEGLDAKELIQDDLFEIFENKNNPEKSQFLSFVLFSWVGKIYRTSDYYNKPTLDEKLMLVCSNMNEAFYFSLLMEQDPKKAILLENIKLSPKVRGKGIVRNINPNATNKDLPTQELAVLKDSDLIKIMSTLPENDEPFPRHYFTIYNDRNFYYDKISNGSVSPQIIIDKANTNLPGKNNCSKAIKDGLL